MFLHHGQNPCYIKSESVICKVAAKPVPVFKQKSRANILSSFVCVLHLVTQNRESNTSLLQLHDSWGQEQSTAVSPCWVQNLLFHYSKGCLGVAT